MSDQDGTNISWKSVRRLLLGRIAEEHNMDASSSKKIGSLPQDTTEDQVAVLRVSLENVPEDFSLMINVNRSVAMKIASLSTQNRTQLLIRIMETLRELLYTSQENNAICAENLLWQQELCESSGQTEKSGSMSLTDFRNKLWNQATSSFRKRMEERRK